ncbi:MAG: hypothetical protein COA43_13810 [Robiginitomaculum sp.]|nr:MAG: hypothetical protein COA43_13810 [Robiginitomaculum sp.]
MNISRLLLIAPMVLTPAFFVACTKTQPAETIFPNTLELPLLAGTTREPECKVDHIFETSERNIECVLINFPEGMEDADEKEQHALNLTRQYETAIKAQGWLANPIGEYIVNFEKPVTKECSISLQLMTWVVDETKPVEERHFPSIRFTFIEKHVQVCGTDRFSTR